MTGLEDLEGGILVTTESEGDREVSRHDRVIVAIPVEQASEIASGLGMGIDGESIPSIVAWGFCDLTPKVPEGFRIHDLGNTTKMVFIPEASAQLIDQRTHCRKLSRTLWAFPARVGSHKWRYSRASSGAGSVVAKDGVCSLEMLSVMR